MAQMYLTVENGGGNINQKGGKFPQQPVERSKRTK